METIEFRARCQKCNSERSLIGPHPARTPADLDAIEHALPKQTIVRCPTCNAVEKMAMFIDGQQTEPWLGADEYERQNGPSAGPLRQKPWPDTN